MISRRFAALALVVLALAGCHEDPTVVKVQVQPSVQSLSINAAGGNASSPAALDGLGGGGGNLSISANGNISLGSPSFPPTAPAAPATPTVTSASLTTPVGTTTISGSILVSGSATTAASTPIVLTSSNGDIVISGLLQSGDTGAAQSDISLVAPNGTVYITGTVRTAGIDSVSGGRSGGNLTISAARVVITGTIDTHGVANTTVVAGDGGNGGNVDIISTQGPIFFTSGSMNTAGGSSTDTAASGGVQGGNGGFIQMNFTAAPQNSVFAFGSMTTTGGAVTGNGATPTGGTGGAVTIRALGELDLSSTISMGGGAATGTAADAVGGTGGALTLNGRATCKMYGSITTAGGTASASVTGGTVTGGAGGHVLLGQTTKLDNVEIGEGTYSMAGGSGGRTTTVAGGPGGTVLVESVDGNISIASSIVTAGGDATGLGNTSGAMAGSITIRTDADGTGNVNNHTLSVPSLSTLLDASGGDAVGTGTGGAGGPVLLRSGGDLTCGARIIASGGASVSGTGGGTTPVAPAVPPTPGTTAVLLQVAAAVQTPTGDLTVTGPIHAQGGAVSTTGAGGSGGSIAFYIAAGSGSIVSSGALDGSGATGLSGAAGLTRDLYLEAQTGNLDLSGTLTVNGASSPTAPSAAGKITVKAGGFITSSATLNSVGGASTDPAGLVNGSAGGDILFDGASVTASITLSSPSFVLADGGTAPGASILTLGGAGGTITLQTRGQPISISGSLLARGGALSGTGVGGLGGLVVANSSSAGDPGGDITLQSGAGIDVSGGSGSTGGSARRNGSDPGVALADPPVNLAVVFDANNDLGASGGASPGKVLNNGSIVANGGSGALVGTGGDVFFNGLNSGGAPVTATDGGSQSRAGSLPGAFYPH